MSYLVLARKWRPSSFADLVGQEHVAQTLQNAITQDRIAHAFLFTGARGVGKTTIARIMAKALNCLGREGVSTEPCLACAACEEIALGRDPDVAEIDGASNNSVDDVRRLQESLPYRPSRDRFKVVIIDEVHMLSIGAFNALLKTLEEPPPHVKFIFATTEAHKVPITILSRCQRYDFRLIPTKLIRDRVSEVLSKESITFDDAAVSLVAREAAGSMRDALSLLDQILAGVDGAITGAVAARLLGVADHRVLYDLARAILQGDATAALQVIALVAREGYDLTNVARAMLGVLRDLVIARVVTEPGELIDVADEERAELTALSAGARAEDLERLFAAWARVSDDVARSREPRWALEMAVVRLAHRPALLGTDELIARLRDLEQRVGGGGGSPPPAEGPRGGSRGAGVTGPARPPTGAQGAASAGRFTAPTRRDEAPKAAVEVSAPRAQGSAAIATRAEAFASRLPSLDPTRRLAEPQAESIAPAEVVEPTVDLTGSTAALPVWTAMVAAMEGPLVPVLKGAVPLEVNPERVRIAVDLRDSFFRRKLATPEAQSAVADGAEQYFHARPTVELVQGILPPEAMSIARAEEAARLEARRIREEGARTSEYVRLVCELLQGEVARVRFDDDPT